MLDLEEKKELENNSIDISNDFDEPEFNIESNSENKIDETKSEIPDWLK